MCKVRRVSTMVPAAAQHYQGGSLIIPPPSHPFPSLTQHPATASLALAASAAWPSAAKRTRCLPHPPPSPASHSSQSFPTWSTSSVENAGTLHSSLSLSLSCPAPSHTHQVRRAAWPVLLPSQLRLPRRRRQARHSNTLQGAPRAEHG